MNDPKNPLDMPDLHNRNVARVLSEIRRKEGATRVELADELDLSPATVTAASSVLIQAGIVRESGVDASIASGRGRPRIQLTLNADALLFAGAKLNDGAITVGIVDFAGRVLAHSTETLPRKPVSAATLATLLVSALDAALLRANVDHSRISAFGLGVPGFIEVETGLCHWSPLMERGAVHLKPLLEDRLGLPVFIDNDANIAALAELWFGYGRTGRDFLVVTVEHGVGLGVVIGGRLFRGARGLGTEFGHIKVQNEGALCRCGQRGCLEAYVADYAVEREAFAALSQNADPEGDARPLVRLAQLAGDGDRIAASIYERAGRMLGLGLANLANIFDPPMIVLAGERIRHHQLLAAEVERTFRANSLVTERDPIPLHVHRWGDELWARGAGALAIDGALAQL